MTLLRPNRRELIRPTRREAVAGLASLASSAVWAAKPKQLCGAVPDAPSELVCTPTQNALPYVQFNGVINGLANSNHSFFGPTNFNFMLHSSWHCNPFTTIGGSDLLFSNINIFDVGAHCVANGSSPQVEVKVGGVPYSTTPIFDGIYVPPGLQQWHVLVSVNCLTQVVQVYVNDAPLALASGGWTGSGPMPGMPDLAMITVLDIGSDVGAGGYPGVAYIWRANTPSWIDLSVVGNRRRFINADLSPVDLGVNGQNPLGYSPPIYLVSQTSDPNDFITNHGTPSVPFIVNLTQTSGDTRPKLAFQAGGTCACAMRSNCCASTWPSGVALWNASDNSGGVLLNNSGTVYNTGFVASGVRATQPQTTGKFYFEFTNNVNGGSTQFGVANTSASLTSGTVGWGLIKPYNTFEVTVNGADLGQGCPTLPWSQFLWGASGITIGVALDLINKRIWFRECPPLSGIWNNNSSADPATNVGGFDISSIATGPIAPAYFCGATSTREVVTANFGIMNFIGVVPSGFTPGFPGSETAAGAANWNTGGAVNTSFFAGNLVAVSGRAASGVGANKTYTSGKVYWEIQVASGYSTYNYVGIANPSVNLSTVMTTGLNAAILYGTNTSNHGQVDVNGVNVTTLTTFGIGSTVGIALDATANRVWFRDLTFGGTWNNSGTANPATGVGGIDVSGIATGGFFAVAGSSGEFAGAQDSSLVNFGQMPCVGGAPAGFGC